MRFFASIAAAAAMVFPLGTPAPSDPFKSGKMEASYYKLEQVMNVDVIIIGGGGMGAYSAIQLKDKGNKVVVLESKDRLGGHTETYMDLETGYPIDMGVKLYHDEPLVHEWFARFNLSLSPFSITSDNPSQNVAFRSGQVLQRLPAANNTAIALALQRYAAVLAKYPQLEAGFYLPDPVPEDLYMPFGQLIQKYDIADAVQTIFGLTSASGDILELPALQQM
jgi:phytoene dehydrogenase-like protein